MSMTMAAATEKNMETRVPATPCREIVLQMQLSQDAIAEAWMLYLKVQGLDPVMVSVTAGESGISANVHILGLEEAARR
ncbi:hypothetical protein [Chlorobium sp. N1]|uniref:hypothetical protein n=1 Tax=Chlorobium sp. N1 TaxID=2491138 RepID=UPI00103E4049|nr:hypothetical protein [Chlorobium sp. N1]TCD47008.1 hypothetical protein E0L29_10250 [Chlorobium sp. N1]